MANDGEQIAARILAVLGASAVPLMAREIADALHGLNVTVAKSAVNSVLYSELSRLGVVTQDSEYRWCATGQSQEAVNGQALSGRVQSASITPVIADKAHSTEEKCRAARRVLQVLRSGTTSCRSAKAISVGTASIEKEVYSRTDSLLNDDTKGEMIVIAADWGFGKSHMRMLLSNHLSERGIPFVHECIDARAASLAHIHRSVPRWLERIGSEILLISSSLSMTPSSLSTFFSHCAARMPLVNVERKLPRREVISRSLVTAAGAR